MGRELTKQFEEIATVPAARAAAPGWRPTPQRTRGEFALVLHPAPCADDDATTASACCALLLAELPVKSAVKLAAEITGAPRNALYELALRLRSGPED